MLDYYAAMDYNHPNHKPASSSPSMSTHQSYISGPPRTSRMQHEHRPSIPKQDRAGKFENLKGFLKQPLSDYSKYGNGVSKQPRPSHIIHITEEDDSGRSYGVRLHQRVMLVIRLESNYAMTCITFCWHPPSDIESEESHWNVLQDNSEYPSTSGLDTPATNARAPLSHAAAVDEIETLFIKLNNGQQLDSDITVNLTELWHVEYDHLSLDIIGCVSKQSWAPVINKIANLFTSSLMAVLPRATTVPDVDMGSERGSDAPLPKRKSSDKHKSRGRRGNDAPNRKADRSWGGF